MASLLNDLVKRVGEVKLDSKLAAKLEELEPGERIVGVLPEELQRFCIVYINAVEELDKLHKLYKLFGIRCSKKTKARKKVTDRQLAKIGKKCDIEQRRLDFIKTAFWSAVSCWSVASCDFPIIDEASIGIRKNWRVVVKNPAIRLISIRRGCQSVIENPIDECATCQYRLICGLISIASCHCIAL
jgi:hypothetical protein